MKTGTILTAPCLRPGAVLIHAASRAIKRQGQRTLRRAGAAEKTCVYEWLLLDFTAQKE